MYVRDGSQDGPVTTYKKNALLAGTKPLLNEI